MHNFLHYFLHYTIFWHYNHVSPAKFHPLYSSVSLPDVQYSKSEYMMRYKDQDCMHLSKHDTKQHTLKIHTETSAKYKQIPG